MPLMSDTGPIKKHSTLFLTDGNVVLCAPTAQGGYTAFCVHRTMLSKVSPVFADMFALPPSNANDSYEGLPLVRMPDKAEDLEQLLKVLYHDTTLPLKRLDPHVPVAVKPVLTLVVKYEIDHLKTQIMARLSEDWPATLQDWDALEAEISAIQSCWHMRHADCTIFTCTRPLDEYLPEPVSALHLAKQCGIKSILPAIYYHLSRLSLRWGSDGFEGTDDEAQKPRLFYGLRTAKWKRLAGEDYYRVLSGRYKMRLAVARILNTWPPDFHEGEPRNEHEREEREGCTDWERSQMVEALQKSVGHEDADVLDELRDRMEDLVSHRKRPMCIRCCVGFAGAIQELRAYLWEHIPEHFALDEA